MGDEYSGKDLNVYYNTVELGAKGRRVRITESAGDPVEVDITHKGDTEEQTLELRGRRVETQVDFDALGEDDDEAALLDFAINAKDTLYVYPEGRTHTKPELTLSNARLISRGEPYEYDREVELSATFKAFNSLTRGTYSSA